MRAFLFIGLILVVGVNSGKMPDYIKKCKKSDNNACVVENALAVIAAITENGEPKYKLQGLKPVHVEKINLQATPQLKVVLEDVNIFGFPNLHFTEGSLDDNEIMLKGHMKRMELDANYDINGRILILPIQGQGTCNITMVDFDVEYKAKLIIEERKGKKYYQVTNDENSQLNILKLGRVYWTFNNLFNGDERLGPEMNRFLNENWEDVFGEVKVSIEQTAAYSIVNYFINGYLHFMPIDELFDA